ncbi:MAG: DoxX family membrane protein [Bacteroidales bacterium]|nr:DoxX family membrane protein [Bacteroidales bacterium]
MVKSLDLSSKQQKIAYTFLSILRIAIGWHLLYEGLTKLFDPSWSAAGYLLSATGPLAGMFEAMQSGELILTVVNFMNTWALILIGLGLFLGLFTRIAQLAGIVLLFMYYISHPPILTEPGFFREGAYFIISKDLLEILALLMLMFFPTGKFLGIDGLRKNLPRLPKHKMDHGQPDAEETKADVNSIHRREVLKHLATVPFLGAIAYGALASTRMNSLEEQNLVDAASGPTQQYVQKIMAGSDRLSLRDLRGKKFTEETNLLKGTLPQGKLGSMSTSKLILGGNLLSGYVHSRDLIYVSSLVLNYHQKDRIFRTLMLAEQSGVNTILSHPIVMPIMEQYWKEGYGKIQFISDCAGLEYSDVIKPMEFRKYIDLVKRAIDKGATACYIQGETADYYIENNKVDKLVKVMDLVKENGIPMGIGAHKIQTIKKCVELGLEHDFWMKTLHTHDYWSAQHPTWNDNMYCYDPDETIRYMEGLEKPWIAFKTLAAGAIKPEDAFPYSFNQGADFICVGMYDFQIIDDVNIALDALDNVTDRKRPWRA